MVPTSLDRASLHAAYADGLAPAAVVAAVRARIEAAADPGIFLHLADAEELARATAALPPFDPARFPLWGLPCAVKDNIDVARMPTTCACPDFAYRAENDAGAVERLRAAGALVVGKTNLDQFATGLVGVRTPYPVPLNALDPALVPGGSSSGSALAVARGLVSFALGTDTAGSGRVPAALNGVVGWKPSLGAVSTRGVVPACRTLDCVAVFAGTVDDAWAVFAALAAYDDDDPFSRHRPPRAWAAMPAGVRVGVPSEPTRRFFGDVVQAAAYARDLHRLEALGAVLVPLDFAAFYAVADLLYEGAWLAERYAAVAEFWREHPQALHPTTAAIIAKGGNISAVAAFADRYRLAELSRAVERQMAAVDLLALPSIPRLVTRAEIRADPIKPNRELGTYTNFANLLDLCAVTLPSPPRSDGGPSSLTLLARGGEDGRLLPVARALTGGAGAVDRAGDDEIELAVIGAHLSGLALNGELTRRGARLLRRLATQPEYRLYALDGEPARPGLLRTGQGRGRSIGAEVWALAPAAFASFANAIPAPLSLGRVRLDDGSAPLGFLVEAAATAGARDITAHGGWRAYIAGR